MLNVLLIVHLMIAIALVAVVLLQRSEGGGLGMGGGMSGFMTGRSTANLLTRTTAVLAALFVITSLVLAKISGGPHEVPSILESPPPLSAPAVPVPAEPAAPLAR